MSANPIGTSQFTRCPVMHTSVFFNVFHLGRLAVATHTFTTLVVVLLVVIHEFQSDKAFFKNYTL